MPIRKREGNRPDRRLAEEGSLGEAGKRELLKRIRYVGSGHHKLRPADYGLVPPNNPRANKSVCDDLGPMPLRKARALFRGGVERGMVSPFPLGGVPKYVWAIDAAGEVWEAKTHPEHEFAYHGYRLGDDERNWRRYLTKEWKKRCP